MKRRNGVAVSLAIMAFAFLACSKPESSQNPATPSSPEPQAVAQAPQVAADTAQAAAQPAAGQQEGTPPAAVPASDKAYVCDMGCEVVDHPGKCSMCGMTLKEVNRADLSFVCETCGFTSDKPGACPKDHTVLVMKIQEKKA
jgi:primosomal protein N'